MDSRSAGVRPNRSNRRPWSRRRRLLLRMLPIALGLSLVVAGPAWLWNLAHAAPSLGQAGIGIGAAGAVVPLTDTDRLLPGTRVLATAPDAAALAAGQNAWLAAGRVPAPAELGDSTMVRDALLDLRLLTAGQRAPIAGWSPPWRYVWPRDSSFAAVAFARTGHPAEAVAILDELQEIQHPDGTFEARYRPGQAAPPDDRGVELDGTGWALWALGQVDAQTPVAQRPSLIARYRRLLDRSVALITARTSDGSLPVSTDYWETRETKPTLATSAVLLAGLDAAAGCERDAAGPNGTAADADALTTRADALRARLITVFGPDFPRRLGDSAGTVDLGVAFLLPPFGSATEPVVVQGWRDSLRAMARPAAGLAPGGSWKSDGISWTPTTATEAMTAAAIGDRAAAVRWLRWLDSHRTAQGAIPEKVIFDGRPASVAPLAWSAAATVIAADELVEH